MMRKNTQSKVNLPEQLLYPNGKVPIKSAKLNDLRRSVLSVRSVLSISHMTILTFIMNYCNGLQQKAMMEKQIMLGKMIKHSR